MAQCHLHTIDHEVPNAALEWDIDSVGRLFHFSRNPTQEHLLQVDRLVIGEGRLSLGLLVHLDRKRSAWKTKCKKGLTQMQKCTKTFMKSVKLTCRGTSRCAVNAPYHRWVGPAQVAWWHGEDCDCQWTPVPPGSLCSAWQRGRAVEDGRKL